jgi:hypothetical protein
MLKQIIYLSVLLISYISYGQNYVFFLHNKFLEENNIETVHPEFGKSEYNEILKEFRNADCIVLSEKRKKNTDVKKYAIKIISQIDSLFNKGVQAKQITVIGTSKGGYIAQYVSTYLKNPDVNFIFIGCFTKSDIREFPDIQFCGRILNIYEKSDNFGVSAIKRKKISKLEIKEFKEIELKTNLKHGFLYKALPEWINPCIEWIKKENK